jgi:hypothetical protein
MEKINVDFLRKSPFVLLEAISGSRAYGLNIATSDTDYKGVFYAPPEYFLGMGSEQQVNNETNDIVFYELGRWMDLLAKNNPNLLELLATPDDCIVRRHPIMDKLKPEIFLSRLCRDSFAGYAMAQIRKARGLNKKVLNPLEKERKGILHFCHIVKGQGTVPLISWLAEKGWKQEDCGLVNLAHAREGFVLFHNPGAGYRGIAAKETSNEVSVSSIPKGVEPDAVMFFNQDGYQRYCKDYLSYWEWVENRNEARYENTISHGKNYDSKNMMHVFRLLDMALEIATEKRVNVRRPDRDFYLSIRSGEFEYNDLLALADERIAAIDTAYAASDLPEAPDEGRINDLLVEMRRELYGIS